MLTSALVLCALLAASAGARRDDLQPEARSPADGAVITDASTGVAVLFTCPEYHPSAYDQVVDRDGDGYHVLLARAADLGPDGLLLAADRVDRRDAITADGKPGFCTAAPDASDRGLLPTEPGTYWWQPYRDCESYICATSVEAGDPARLVVRRTVCSVTRGALATARRALTMARAELKRRRTAARRARVATLDARVVTLTSRLSVVYHCRS